MRLSILSLLAGAAALVAAEALGDSNTDKDAAKDTTFDSKPVPPLIELTPSNWAEQVNKTRWFLVKHFRYELWNSIFYINAC
jgi:protein disulfide-isomerase